MVQIFTLQIFHATKLTQVSSLSKTYVKLSITSLTGDLKMSARNYTCLFAHVSTSGKLTKP